MLRSSLKSIIVLLAMSSFVTSCAVVQQGEVGVKRTLGRYSDKVYTSGLRVFNPFVSTIVKVPVQTNNLEVQLDIPSKEGLTIRSEVSILYNIEPKKAPDVLRNIGIDYEATIILPVFRSAVADISAKYFAKDMHTGNRTDIEKNIRELMMETMKGKGIFIENVLLKSIQLPRSLSKAIEEKLEAEQQAMRMEFILQGAKREAERKLIEAEGVSKANAVLSEGLTDKILQFKSIEAWLKLAESPNAKVIMTQGNVPMMMSSEINSTGGTMGTGSNLKTTTSNAAPVNLNMGNR
jgi:regulator of protease activity HflC (stomatin/prohibitin superfamily)